MNFLSCDTEKILFYLRQGKKNRKVYLLLHTNRIENKHNARGRKEKFLQNIYLKWTFMQIHTNDWAAAIKHQSSLSLSFSLTLASTRKNDGNFLLVVLWVYICCVLVHYFYFSFVFLLFPLWGMNWNTRFVNGNTIDECGFFLSSPYMPWINFLFNISIPAEVLLM